MYLLVVGLVLVTLKFVAYGPVANWSWLLVLSPFPLAIVWWTISDLTGRTARTVMDRENRRKAERKERNRVNTGASVVKKK